VIGQWVYDYNFEALIKYVLGENKVNLLEKSVRALVKNGECKQEDIQFIKDTHFHENISLTVYVLTRLNLLYSNSDAEEFEILRTEYEQEIDKYLEKLRAIEENIAKNKAESYELQQKRETEDEQK